ncbi:response regulator [Nitrososphaera sp.]|uniref:response regulator n=1 Tax=Nitrososphaera sp. TaxID=1971748 RepID=UPI00307E6311
MMIKREMMQQGMANNTSSNNNNPGSKKGAMMRVLVAEDDGDVARMCRLALESRGHSVTITADGQECVKAFRQAAAGEKGGGGRAAPFDVVVLDYRMPRVDGLEAAKEILRLNRQQRIIFASAYVKETLMDSVKQLDQVVELIQKPFEPKVLVDLIEDRSTTKELKEINRLVAQLDPSRPSDDQIKELLDALKKIQKAGGI